ncbi:hypothetical protein CsatA_010539 [Cannabis sativa]
MPVLDSGARMWDWVTFLWNLKSRGVDTDELFLYASIVVDTIWRARNDKSVGTQAWSPPPEDWVKINCDVKVGGETMCAVAIARDHNESVLWVAAKRLHFSDPLTGEAAACLLAMETAVSLHHPFILVESDSKIVIKNLKGDDSIWRIENYVRHCKLLSTFMTNCNFSYIARNCNYAAHNVAKWAFANNVTGMVEISTIPLNIFCNDHEV